MKRKEIPEPFHPGEYLREELEARNWTEPDLIKNTKNWSLSVETVSNLIEGKESITYRIAKALEDGLGIVAGVWLNLQAVYDERMKIRSARRQR